MAMIYCSACGKQISDKAAACPHCGAARVAADTVNTPTPVQPQAPVQQAAVKNQNKSIIAVGIVISVLIIALIVVILVVFGGKSDQGNELQVAPVVTQSNSYTPATENNYVSTEAPVPQVFNVDLYVECERNSFMNKYDVAILVDGRNLVTLPHGASDAYRLQLEAGSHAIEFRIASNDITGNSIYQKSDKGSYKEKFINVSQDMSVYYYIKLDYGNDIEVTQY